MPMPASPPSIALLLLLFIPLLSAVRSPLPFDYKDALSKSILYFEAQRSGHLPHNQRVSWRHHSALTDGLQQGVDLVGGYYDAGDHVKFGLPMAFTVTMLSWSAIEYGHEISAAGEHAHLLEAIKWGTDYFIKAHTHPNVLWAERPEDMTTSRRAYKIDAENPGSDLAGETAAAMAAASIVFRGSNPHYSHLLLHHAQQLFEFGERYRGRYDRSVGAAKGYYASVSGYRDELLWAALWLLKATGREEYLEYAVDKAESFGGTGWDITEFSWEVKYAGVQVLAAQLLAGKRGKLPLQRKHIHILERYRSKAEHYICACLGKNNSTRNVERTPAGLLFVRPYAPYRRIQVLDSVLRSEPEFDAFPDAHEIQGGNRRLISIDARAIGGRGPRPGRRRTSRAWTSRFNSRREQTRTSSRACMLIEATRGALLISPPIAMHEHGSGGPSARRRSRLWSGGRLGPLPPRCRIMRGGGKPGRRYRLERGGRPRAAPPQSGPRARGDGRPIWPACNGWRREEAGGRGRYEALLHSLLAESDAEGGGAALAVVSFDLKGTGNQGAKKKRGERDPIAIPPLSHSLSRSR